ncbi:TIGR02530 family flagellar biosynthesis protein [Trichlorobacter ammonificans]|uniref:Flagellar operon protein n=1 Tax=Trichlorobacter ammonificans TaxID=2916410 RepID=A0ABM9D418_9BACT|nr:TIGR02530 family flagellar biosynthesis protein [Trichlorobacter ammonificans]CAH2029994.1 Flagellar operon protein [Trichlorobacter ammonificans]
MSGVDQIFLPNPLQPATAANQPARQQPAKAAGESPFARMLEQTQGVRFSQHAQDRLRARNITFSQDQLQQLAGAVNSVAQKGGRESLVMMGDAALVVSISNRTVVTAMDRAQMKGNVFTNIDSAVVI